VGSPSAKDDTVTKNRFRKQAVRAIAEQKDVKYTAALRDLPPDRDGLELVVEQLRPGRVVVAVNGGGATNLALLLPHVVRLHRAGHPLLVVPYGPQHGDLELPSVYDFLVLHGVATAVEIAPLATDPDITRLKALVDQLPPIVHMEGGGDSPGAVRAQLDRMREQADGKAPILFVQDIDTDDVPIANPRALEQDPDIAADDAASQAAALQRLARDCQAIVACGHCMPVDADDGWKFLTQIVDHTIAIHEDADNTEPRAPRAAVLVHYENGRETARNDTVIDYGFRDWIHEVLAERQARRERRNNDVRDDR
jgi:hypothetical protein